MPHFSRFTYTRLGTSKLFTAILLPSEEGKFPTVICRSPYVGREAERSEDEIVCCLEKSYCSWLDRGYAVVFQHCEGCGKSSGDFIPYLREREAGLALLDFIRGEPFYNGELFLLGTSYTASLHYATAPFSKDIKGAVFEVQDSERYRLWYRNGQLRRGHANWYFGLYKQRLKKSFSSESFSELPLAGLSERAFCEVAEDFEKTLTASDPRSSFWSTRLGGADTRGATNNAGIPLLLTTGYNDFYVGGVFKMWREMSEKTKRISAMLVSPYDHSDGFDKDAGIEFPLGKRREAFGKDYQIDWFDSIRLGTPLPYKRGVITYYRAFEDRWDSDFYKGKTKGISLPLGEGEAVFDYDPKTPATFSAEGRYQREFFEGDGVIKLYTPPAQQDIFVKGAMRLSLAASSSAQDTSFYAAISIQKPSGDYTLRHDVTSIRYQRGDYSSGETVELSFSFDEYAFLLKRGERLRIDIAATDAGVYVCHTNQAGEYYKICESIKATNRVDLSLSRLILPIEV